MVFVGPRPETLDLFGDKAAARALRRQNCGVPVLAGTAGATTLDAGARLPAIRSGRGGAIMLKAIAGGGGRGMRPVTDPDELADAFERCRAEAQQAFGNGDLYVERLFPRARHVEVQIVGDGTGAVAHLWDRECSLQRAAPEDHRDRPGAIPASGRCASGCCEAAVTLAAPPNIAASAPSNSWSTRSTMRRCAIAFIEANAAAAGRAHGDRGGDRPRSGAAAVRDRRAARRCAELGLTQGDIPAAARHGAPGAHQYGDA